MSADLSRIRSNPLADYSSVLLKQGAVLLDAEMNELTAIVDRRIRAAASDILGRARVSSTTPDAFRISAIAGGLAIGRGRLYVDGLLAENHGRPQPADAALRFDPLLAEGVHGSDHSYASQPWLPAAIAPALPSSGRHLVYLDVWEREVTHIEEPTLVEPAVGVETSARSQVVWQVRVLDNEAGNASCGVTDAEIAGWSNLIRPSSGRLSTGSYELPASADPCELPPTGGYRGLENQTYRVEIHAGGLPGSASFKWSRENASVASRVTAIVSPGELELASLGRDEVLRFSTGDWVEISNDLRELQQEAGVLRRITVDDAASRISFAPPLPTQLLQAGRNLRVRRWDQRHEVLRATGNGGTAIHQDLDAAGSDGSITVPASASTELLIEHGISVRFSAESGRGFKPGDYWVFAARTADGSVEVLDRAPPRGIHHHYARLGFWDAGATTVGPIPDCRQHWPPAQGAGHDCACTVCVTEESHASGSLTLQAAVDQLRDSGGTVCLGVGNYTLSAPVRINGIKGLRIRGQGIASLINAPDTAFLIGNSLAIAIEDLMVLNLAGRVPVSAPVNATVGAAVGANGQAVATQAAIAVRNVVGLRLERLYVVVLGNLGTSHHAIALDGVAASVVIRDNGLIAPIGIGALSLDPKRPTPTLLAAALEVSGNLMFCVSHGLRLDGRVLHLAGSEIRGNSIVGASVAGLSTLGLGAPGAALRIAGNRISSAGDGIVSSVDGLWIDDNTLRGRAGISDLRAAAQAAGDAIRLSQGPLRAAPRRAQVMSNQISGHDGAAVRIDARVGDLLIKHNLIADCGEGIVGSERSGAASIAIDNNRLRGLGRGLEAAEVAGISVLRAEVASILGNHVAELDAADGAVAMRLGIVATAVRRISIGSNQVTGLATPVDGQGDLSGAVGILVRHGFAGADIAHNRVERAEAANPDERGNDHYLALLVHAGERPRGPSTVPSSAAGTTTSQPAAASPGSGGLSTVALADGRLLVVGSGQAFVSGEPPDEDQAPLRASASVTGNQLIGRSDLGLAWILVSGDCQFSDNHCQMSGSSKRGIVLLEGQTLIVNANRVSGIAEFSVVLITPSKTPAVLGNITDRDFKPKLVSPWAQLNLRV